MSIQGFNPYSFNSAAQWPIGNSQFVNPILQNGNSSTQADGFNPSAELAEEEAQAPQQDEGNEMCSLLSNLFQQMNGTPAQQCEVRVNNLVAQAENLVQQLEQEMGSGYSPSGASPAWATSDPYLSGGLGLSGLDLDPYGAQDYAAAVQSYSAALEGIGMPNAGVITGGSSGTSSNLNYSAATS